MAPRRKVAFVTAALYHDELTGIYSVEFAEWRSGSHSKLAAFLEIGPFGVLPAELEAAKGYLGAALDWLVGDVLELDKGSMF